MSDDNKKPDEPATTEEPGPEASTDPNPGAAQSGPKFTEGPDPLASVKKGASDVLDSMEGKSVSMKTYVGTIIAVVVLMLLARCGG